MIDTEEIIHRHCAGNSELEQLLLQHSRDVARRALQVADRHPELGLNREFLQEAAMLHDIGITLVDAPGIHCHDQLNYSHHLSVSRSVAASFSIASAKVHQLFRPCKHEAKFFCKFP